ETTAQRWRFLLAILAASFLLSCVAFYQYILGPGAYSSLGPAFARSTFVTDALGGSVSVFRPNSTFSWPTHFAILLAFATFLAIAVVLSTHGFKRLISWIIVGVLTAANIVEGQRTFLILIPLLLLVILVLRRTARVGVVLLVAAGLTLVVMALLGATGWFGR